MTKLISLSNMAKAGWNTDLPPWDLPGDNQTLLENIRVQSMNMSPFGAAAVWDTMAGGINIGTLQVVKTPTANYWLLLGLNEVLVYDGGTFTDISSTAGYATVLDEDLWSSCLLSSVPIINHETHFPEYWPQQSTGIKMEPLPWDATRTWSDVNERCKIIRSHKQFLFALNLTSNSEEVPDGVRWSTPADVSGVPDSWDNLDTTKVAGFVKLGGDSGDIIDGLSLRDAFIVYRKSGISIFDYVGGQFVWRIRHLSTSKGLLSPDCLVEAEGIHYFISDGDIMATDGNSLRSITHNRIRTQLAGDIDADNFKNSFAVRNGAKSEIWFCIPSAGATYPDTVYIYNWRDDTWAVRNMPQVAHMDYGPRESTPITWDTVTGSWDESTLSWTQEQSSPFDETLIGVRKSADGGDLIEVDVGPEGNIHPFNSKIERIGFALEGLKMVTTVTRVYPKMTGTEPVMIQMGSQDYPGAPTRWKPAVEFNPVTDRKVDVRTTGELQCYRIFANDVKGVWAFSGMDIEYVVEGER